MSRPAYDEIGVNYSDFRCADPRIEAGVWAALRDARSVVNIGAGTGSYEPRDREVIAVEPSSLILPEARIETVPMPGRCRDEFTSALWDRPELFLEPATLRADLESGRWDERHGHLRTLPELDIGLRLVRAEL
jgi:hypothetical protein